MFAYKQNYKIYPLYNSEEDFHIFVDRLYMKNENNVHYAWIKKYPNSLNSQLSKNKNLKYICRHCLNLFGVSELLLKHKKFCSKNKVALVKMPENNEKMLQFQNIRNQQLSAIYNCG